MFSVDTRGRTSHFHPRCSHASEVCRQTYPDQTDLGGGHWVRCHWVAGQA
jgi:peptide/nickel transport system ATP-binding protein